MFVITKTNTNQNKAIMNLQDFTNRAEKLGYKRITDTYENKFGEKLYAFTYEKSDYHIYHWFIDFNDYMLFSHTYSTDSGWTKKSRNKQAWRLILGE
tara:strand:+ start:700 stop:990 length:291 start_codon:yes stop_codon:yes gene_type:complete